MITTFQMYWLVTLDGIIVMASIIFAVSLFVSVGFGVCGAVYRCKGREYSWDTDETIAQAHKVGEMMHRKIALPSAIVCLISATIMALMPSTKQMAAIIIVPRIANSEKVQTVGNHLYGLAVDWMNELRPNKKGEKQ